MQEREPDQTTDPREQGTGQGYPETNPASSTPDEGTQRGPEADTGDGGDQAADTHAGEDEKPSGATGNPNAAGG